MSKKIFVTKPFLPPLDEYVKYLEKIWSSKQLTNNGPFHQKFEKELANYLGVRYVSLINNATTGLLVAIKTLELKGEIITTPYSFSATAHSIIWNGLTPVFVDTDSTAGNLNPSKVEAAVNNKTGGIVAVHNYGIPGDVDGLENVAKKYNLPIIYDAAPAMGVKYKGNSIFGFGDLAIMSFHATKIFTTLEGGAIISRSSEIKTKIDRLKNFAILSQEKVSGLGINGKMNEAEAALGLLQLKYIEKNICKRKNIYDLYIKLLEPNKNIRLLNFPKFVKYNYAYLPVFFNEGILVRDRVYKNLKERNIICRKYWYPLLTDHDFYKNSVNNDLINARKLSESVLCLPIYPDLNQKNINLIIQIIEQTLR
jgi:dTDP-4-amino-4,6-dideoxygalactose transaminase